MVPEAPRHNGARIRNDQAKVKARETTEVRCNGTSNVLGCVDLSVGHRRWREWEALPKPPACSCIEVKSLSREGLDSEIEWSRKTKLINRLPILRKWETTSPYRPEPGYGGRKGWAASSLR
jgi:hypothetical protein